MVSFIDSIGNAYIGDCLYGNHDIGYPTVDYLKAQAHSGIAAEITSICSTKSIDVINESLQVSYNNYDSNVNLGNFKFSGDPSTNPSYRFRIQSGNTAEATWGEGSGSGSFWNVFLYNDASGTIATLSQSISVGISLTPQSGATRCPNSNIDSSPSTDVQWAGVSDGQSLGLYTYGGNLSTQTFGGTLWYFGELADVNPNFGYYNAEYRTAFIALGVNAFGVRAFHYINGAGKVLLQSGDANYTIVCDDAQTPTATWATDMAVFDNNATLGYPRIGTVRNLLLATGSFTIGKPVQILGGTQPDSGFNRWLPVGTYAGKTLLMRCYSSQT